MLTSVTITTWDRLVGSMRVWKLVPTLLCLAALQQLSSALPQSNYDPDREVDEQPATNNPRITSAPLVYHATLGGDIRLPCRVEDLGEYVVLWRRNEGKDILFAGSVRVKSDPRLSVKDTGRELVISGAREDDEGDYTCELSTNPPLALTHNVTFAAPAISEQGGNSLGSSAASLRPVSILLSSAALLLLLFCL